MNDEGVIMFINKNSDSYKWTNAETWNVHEWFSALGYLGELADRCEDCGELQSLCERLWGTSTPDWVKLKKVNWQEVHERWNERK